MHTTDFGVFVVVFLHFLGVRRVARFENNCNNNFIIIIILLLLCVFYSAFARILKPALTEIFPFFCRKNGHYCSQTFFSLVHWCLVCPMRTFCWLENIIYVRTVHEWKLITGVMCVPCKVSKVEVLISQWPKCFSLCMMNVHSFTVILNSIQGWNETIFTMIFVIDPHWTLVTLDWETCRSQTITKKSLNQIGRGIS